MKTSFFKSPFLFPMGKFKMAGALILIGFFIYSCQKSFDVVPSSNEKIRPRVSGVTVQENMLKFDDMDAVEYYLSLVEERRDDHLNDDDSYMLLSDVDPGVNDLEDQLDFLCISSLYDSLEYLNDEFRSNARGNLSIYIGDPIMQLILNRHHEVWVEDTIYKVVANYKYYKIEGADIDILNSIRSNPEEPTVDTFTSVVYFNDNVPPIEFRNFICEAFLEFLLEPPASGLDPTVYI